MKKISSLFTCFATAIPIRRTIGIFAAAATCLVMLSADEASFAQGAWIPKADFGGGARASAVGFSIGSKGYIGTGYEGTQKQDFWEWDQATNVWTQKADFSGGARSSAVGFSIGTKGYIGTGEDATKFKDFWEWNQATNVWTQKTDFGGGARSFAVGFSIGTKGYIGTGFTTIGNDTLDFWEWDQATDIWTKKANFGGTGRALAVGFSIGTKGYIGTGFLSFRDFWEWDQATDIWTQKAAISIGRMGAVGFSIGTKGYIGIGQSIGGGGPQLDFLEWDQTSNIWTKMADFGGGGERGYAVGFSIGSKGYIGTGETSIFKKDFWEYTCAIPSYTVSKTNVSCNGGSNGYAAINPTGTAPYSYAWSNGTTTSSVYGLMAGTYSVVVIDNAGCGALPLVTITQPNPINIAFNTTNASCNSVCNGMVSATVTVGTAPYTYLWSPGGYTTSACSNLCADTYTLNVTDANGCTKFALITLVTDPAMIPVFTTTSASCKSVCDATANVTVTNGTVPYTYLWSPGGYTTSACSNLCADTYTLNITDVNGCTKPSAVSITQPDTLSLIKSVTHASCYNNDGAAGVTPNGGTPPYAYLWSSNNTDQNITGMPGGTHSITVTDNNGCVISDTLQIKNSVPSAMLPICAVTVDSLSKYNLIIWDKTSYPIADTFLIYRDTANNKYGLIGKVPYDSLSQFIDTVRTKYAANGDPNASTWKYKIAAKDTCGNLSPMSPYHKTLFIQNNSANFSWNDYLIEGQAVPVPALSNYLFQRDDSSNGNWQTIQTLSASSLAYTDGAYSTYQSTGAWRVITAWSIECTPTLKNPVPMGTTINNSKSNTFKTIAPTGVNSVFADDAVSIYPNPFAETATLQITNPRITNFKLTISDVFGRSIYSADVRNSNQFVISRDGFVAGIYFLKVISDQETVIKKVIVTH